MRHASASGNLKNNACRERALIGITDRKPHALRNLARRLLQPRKGRRLFLANRDGLVYQPLRPDSEFHNYFAAFVGASRGVGVILYEIAVFVSLGQWWSDGSCTHRSPCGRARLTRGCASVRRAKKNYSNSHQSKHMHTNVLVSKKR